MNKHCFIRNQGRILKWILLLLKKSKFLDSKAGTSPRGTWNLSAYPIETWVDFLVAPLPPSLEHELPPDRERKNKSGEGSLGDSQK